MSRICPACEAENATSGMMVRSHIQGIVHKQWGSELHAKEAAYLGTSCLTLRRVAESDTISMRGHGEVVEAHEQLPFLSSFAELRSSSYLEKCDHILLRKHTAQLVCSCSHGIGNLTTIILSRHQAHQSSRHTSPDTVSFFPIHIYACRRCHILDVPALRAIH